MAFVELDTDTLHDEISNNEVVLVQYAAGWCGNCRIMKPKFKKFAQDHENVKFIVIDAEKNPESRKLAKVDNLPTFAAFRNGELIQQIQTNKTEVLKSFIDETTSN